jgi:hypothetical protein
LDKIRTFSTIDHSAPKGQLMFDADLRPLVLAIQSISEAVKELQKIKPDVIEVKPVVQIPESPIHVTLPELCPTVEVKPSDVVIQRQDGVISDIKPVVHVHIPTKGILWILALIPLLMLIDLIALRIYSF